MIRKPMRIRLTSFIAVCACALTLLACETPAKKKPRAAEARVAPIAQVRQLDPLLEDVEKRTFNFFWETTEGATGLVPDRWPSAPFCARVPRPLQVQAQQPSGGQSFSLGADVLTCVNGHAGTLPVSTASLSNA